jgi:hypothetical protein
VFSLALRRQQLVQTAAATATFPAARTATATYQLGLLLLTSVVEVVGELVSLLLHRYVFK